MKFKKMPSLEYLRSVLEYNPDSGEFKWKLNTKCKGRAASKAGTIAGWEDSYKKIRLDGVVYKGHRIAYYMHTGIDPLENQIDHVDGNTLNNKASNLRIATHSQNKSNTKTYRNNTTGHKNIVKHPNPNGTFSYNVQISKDGVLRSKRFPHNEEGLTAAIAYRDKTLKLLHGDFARFS